MIIYLNEQNDPYINTIQGVYKVISKTDMKSPDGHILYNMVCTECGKEVIMRIAQAKRTSRCRHFNGPSHTWKVPALAKVFNGMKQRCQNPNDKDYRNYGAKGVTICDEWLNNPGAFEEWMLENGYQPGYDIDRIDSDLGYNPTNCQVISHSENCRRAGNPNQITVNGQSLTGRQCAKLLGVSNTVINNYIKSHGTEKVTKLMNVAASDTEESRKAKIAQVRHSKSLTLFDVYNID